MPTYRLSTYDVTNDPEDYWGWEVRLSGLSLWNLREAIRWARESGYDDDVSILVEREETTIC